MYDAFVLCMLDSLEEVAGPDWKPGCREAWRAALERLAGSMRRAGGASSEGILGIQPDQKYEQS
jgi:hypothetical protein